MDKPAIGKREKWILLTLLIIPCVLINLKLDNDIWFLLHGGRYVLQNGIPHTDPFVLHENLT